MYTHTCVRCERMCVFPGGTCARPTRLLLWGILGRVVLAVVALLLQLILLPTPSLCLSVFALVIARSTQRRVFVSVSCSVLFSSIYRRPRVAPQAAEVKPSSSCVSHAIRWYKNPSIYIYICVYDIFIGYMESEHFGTAVNELPKWIYPRKRHDGNSCMQPNLIRGNLRRVAHESGPLPLVHPPCTLPQQLLQLMLSHF